MVVVVGDHDDGETLTLKDTHDENCNANDHCYDYENDIGTEKGNNEYVMIMTISMVIIVITMQMTTAIPMMTLHCQLMLDKQ